MYVQVSKARSIADIQYARYKERDLAFSKLSFGDANTVIAFIPGDKGEINICADVVPKKKKKERRTYAQYILSENNQVLHRKVFMGDKGRKKSK